MIPLWRRRDARQSLSQVFHRRAVRLTSTRCGREDVRLTDVRLCEKEGAEPAERTHLAPRHSHQAAPPTAPVSSCPTSFQRPAAVRRPWEGAKWQSCASPRRPWGGGWRAEAVGLKLLNHLRVISLMTTIAIDWIVVELYIDGHWTICSSS